MRCCHRFQDRLSDVGFTLSLDLGVTVAAATTTTA